MNAVMLGGMVIKRYADVLPTGGLFARLVLENGDGVFVAVGYREVARVMISADAGARVVVFGKLRQRRPNGRTLWEIVVQDFILVSQGEQE